MLRSFSLASGELCVMTGGTLLMQQLCAMSWATCEQLQLPGQLTLELEMVHPGIPMCTVEEQS